MADDDSRGRLNKVVNTPRHCLGAVHRVTNEKGETRKGGNVLHTYGVCKRRNHARHLNGIDRHRRQDHGKRLLALGLLVFDEYKFDLHT